MSSPTPDRNLALELVRVTEAAALAASRWVGRGDKNAADGAAVDAMRATMAGVAMDGVVVIGEGEKDEAPMLCNGERIGDGSPPAVDIAVDPLEGTTLTAKGQPNALCVVALSERGTMFDPGPCVYMEKMAGGTDIADLLSLTDPIEDVLDRVAARRRVSVGDLMVVILDRPRHAEQIERIRAHGGRIRLIPDGDVAGSLMAISPEHRRRPAVGHRRHAGGRPLRRGHQVDRRRAARADVAARRRRARAHRRGGHRSGPDPRPATT